MPPEQSTTEVSGGKNYASGQHRAEIEERTANGETCEQIAAALRAKGVDITNKTVSRRRVEWGLRRRPPHKYAGMKLPVARPKKANTKTKSDRQTEMKAKIEARTRQGESAEHITEALAAEGVHLAKGVSTVLRLQTYWGLIPPDKDRARGTLARKQKQAREANRAQRSGDMHYPADCSFGPKKRALGAFADGDIEVEGDLDQEDGAELGEVMEGGVDPQLNSAARTTGDGISVAAEILSVDFLVDLANSTLVATNNLKDMLLAYQAGAPTTNSTSGMPPRLEDLATARRKIREAAAVMHDLAVDPTG